MVYFNTMALFKIRMSGEPAELAGIFRNESRTGRITLSQAPTGLYNWIQTRITSVQVFILGYKPGFPLYWSSYLDINQFFHKLRFLLIHSVYINVI